DVRRWDRAGTTQRLACGGDDYWKRRGSIGGSHFHSGEWAHLLGPCVLSTRIGALYDGGDARGGAESGRDRGGGEPEAHVGPRLADQRGEGGVCLRGRRRRGADRSSGPQPRPSAHRCVAPGSGTAGEWLD